MTPSPNALTFRSIYRRCDAIAATLSRSPGFPYRCFPQPYFQIHSDKLYNSRANPRAPRHERVYFKVSDAIGIRFSIQPPEILCSNP